MASDVTTRLEATPADFKSLFDYLSGHGEFALYRLKDGRWWSKLELPTPEGITVKISTQIVPSAMGSLVALSALFDDLRRALAEGAVK